MIEKNLENSVTCVTHVTLLQRMRNRQQDSSNEIHLVSLPLTVEEPNLPPLVIEWISICLNEGHMQPSQPSRKIRRLAQAFLF
jgi:hypothetical protein